MTITRPWAVDAGFPNAADQRKQLASIYPREGVFPDPVTVAAAGIAFAGTGWGVSARAFVAALKRGGVPYSTAYGCALVSNDATVVNAWTIAAAPGAGSRIDLLCVRARDLSQGDSATGTPLDGPGGLQRTGFPEFIVAPGTSGTPGVRPAVPAGYTELAQITTPAGAVSTAGSTIVHTYGFAYVVGAVAYHLTAASIATWTTNVVAGQRAYALDTKVTWEYNGTAWRPVSGTELQEAFTWSRANVDTTPQYPLLVDDPGNTTDSTLASFQRVSGSDPDGVGGVKIPVPGVYHISVGMVLAAPVTARSFIQIGADTDQFRQRASVFAGEDQLAVNTIVRTTAVDQVVPIWFYKANANLGVNTGRVMVRKL